MKVCVLSHSAVVDVYREKFRRLAELGVEMHLALPSGWPEGNCWVAAPPSPYHASLVSTASTSAPARLLSRASAGKRSS